MPYYERRALVKPGLTGWAQVRCGYAGSRYGTAWKMCHDLYYIKHRSALLDLLILVETFHAVVERNLQVIRQRDRLIAPDQRGERDDAAIAPRKIGTLPNVTEQAILCVFVESRRNHLNVLAGGALVRRSAGGDRER